MAKKPGNMVSSNEVPQLSKTTGSVGSFRKGRTGGLFFTLCSTFVLIYFVFGQQLQLTYADRSLSSDDQIAITIKNVTLYKNGYSTGGVEMQLLSDILENKNGSELAAYLSQFIAVEGLIHQENPTFQHIADRVYNGQGKVLQSYDDIVSGDRLYLVAPELLFVWPFVKRGHRVYVTSENSPTEQPVIVESLTESPRTFILHNFFSYEEADRMIQRILEIDDEKNKLQQSHVGHKNEDKIVSIHRTSENAFDQVSKSAIDIRYRVFDVLSIGEYESDMCDGLQLLRYKQKQAYISHTDYFALDTTPDWNWDPQRGGSNRFATVFLYLSNVTAGGQTVFPYQDMPEDIPESYKHPEGSDEYVSKAKELFAEGSWEIDMVEKCATKLASYPRKGHAILFYSQKPNGQLDPMSQHGGCPVLDGTKWGANLWIWNRKRYGLEELASDKFEVVFHNVGKTEIDLFWSGSLLASVAPGDDMLYQTYTGHKWTVKDKEGHVLKIFDGDAANGDMQHVYIPSDPSDEPKADIADEASTKDEL